MGLDSIANNRGFQAEALIKVFANFPSELLASFDATGNFLNDLCLSF